MLKVGVYSIISVLILSNWTFFLPKSWYMPVIGDIEDILLSHGYALETHTAKTEDGYLLALHRIPRGRNEVVNKEVKKPPVLLMHGLACSSVDWIIKGPEQAMALVLADAGYDVWMGNNRGNTYSRHHISLNPDIQTKKFFNYSYHDLGIYDIPAMIDCVLNATGYQKLTYIGFSEGFTAFIVMGSLRPEYNEKVLLMNAFAPVTNIHNVPNLIFNSLALSPKILEIPAYIGLNEIVTRHTSPILRLLCNVKPLCRVIFSVSGLSKNQLDNQEFLLKVLSNFPAGISLKQLTHYVQGTRTGTFRPYDYGNQKNVEIYGSTEPAPYDLAKVTAPFIMYYGEDDIFVNNDILLNSVVKTLPNVKKVFHVPIPNFNHLDFIWGKDIRPLVEEALRNINKYNNYRISNSTNSL